VYGEVLLVAVPVCLRDSLDVIHSVWMRVFGEFDVDTTTLVIMDHGAHHVDIRSRRWEDGSRKTSGKGSSQSSLLRRITEVSVQSSLQIDPDPR
jgi:hypothetical protein